MDLFNEWLDVFNSFMPVTTEKTEKLDLSKDEDYDKVKDMINEARETSDTLGGFWGKTLCGSIIDEIEDLAKSAHEKAVEEKKEAEKKETLRPSTKVSKEVVEKVHKLVDAYTKEVIEPACEGKKAFTDEQFESAKDGLVEFACWMYNR